MSSFFHPSQRPAQLHNGQVDLSITGVSRTTVGQAKRGGRRRTQDQEGGAAGTGTVSAGGKIDPMLQMGRPVIGRGHLHIVGPLEDGRHLVGNEVVARFQGDLCQGGLSDGSGGVGHIREQRQLAVPHQRVLEIKEGRKHIIRYGPLRTGRGDVKRKVVNNHLFNNKSLSHYNKKPSRAT